MNIRDKIHPSKQPVGATHYNEDWHCSETEGIQYFKVAADAYHFWSGGRWVIGNTRMPSRTITPLPNLQIETYAAAPHVNCNFASLTKDLKPTDPTDELGKVWDVLHAAGINSGGELSASEGVKLLADKLFEASLTTIQLDDHSALVVELTGVLAGMLFEFDDGVNGGTESPLPVLNHARTLVDAKQWGEG